MKRMNIAAQSRETPKERDARLAREAEDAVHARRLEFLIHVTVLVAVGIVGVLCIILVGWSGATADNARWASTVLTTIVSGGVGYMTGKKSK